MGRNDTVVNMKFRRYHYYLVGMACLMVILLVDTLTGYHIGPDNVSAIITGIVSMSGIGIAGKCFTDFSAGKNFNKDYWEATKDESK